MTTTPVRARRPGVIGLIPTATGAALMNVMLTISSSQLRTSVQ